MKPLHLMYAEPARRFIESHGGAVLTGVTARIVVDGDEVVAVEGAGERWTAGAVISAVPWFALRELFDVPPPALEEILSRASRMASSPIVTVNLWFDRQVLDRPFLGLPGRAMQWVFDKRSMQDGAASHLSLVSSGASPLVGMANDSLVATAHQELLEALPDIRAARLLRATVIREPQRHLLAGTRPTGASVNDDAGAAAVSGRRLD